MIAFDPNNRDARNLIEAVSSGATISVKVVTSIAANLIAYLALLAFINAVLSWLGNMVDIDGLSFQLICSYILRPVAFLMGVAWEDCPVVAELLGIKLFLNKFVAYQELSKYKQLRLAGAEEWAGTRKQWISVSVSVPSLQPGSLGLEASWGSAHQLLSLAGILYVPRGSEVNCMSLLNTTLSSSSFEVYQCCREAFQSVGLEFGPVALSNCCQFYSHEVCA
ncbi:PREDICTED: sodium/nucleoside cotransporter 1-like [Propithecus coquereli]|uniref:sodium/nucleoside cotransporter 1-like n=1 Tax=Propithecus coquereli TaxID=379532 RepID=UPI00063F80C6|nr:PREDICTED: sodium/nucleoside cotransporter 1-like [Propithecus coquereli]